MFSDLKYTLRQLAKNRGLTATIILILALGIGANTAVFTVIDALLLRGLPVHNPQELVAAYQVNRSTSALTSGDFPISLYEQFRAHAQSLQGVIASFYSNQTLVDSSLGQSEAIPIQSDAVSGNFFSMIGIPPYLGRTLLPDDDRLNAPRAVAVISYAFWQRQFGGDPKVLGRTVLINNVPISIVGVAPAGFAGMEVGSGRQENLWFPLQMVPRLVPATAQVFANPRQFAVVIMGRLRTGVTRQTANAELNVIYRSVLATEGVFTEKGPGRTKIDLEPGGNGFFPSQAQLKSLLVALLGVTGMVLLLSCANVASLLLARIAARQREFALRIALGASRGRLVRQLTIDGLFFAVIGGLLGLLLAHWGTRLLAGYLPQGGLIDLRPDGRILLFAFVLSATAGILIGFIPALKFSRPDVVLALKDRSGGIAGGSSQRMNRALVTAQITLSVCLLAGASLFIRTLKNLENIDLGFNRRILSVNVPFDRSYDSVRKTTLLKDELAALSALPGVRRATFSDALPFTGGSSRRAISLDGYVPKPDENMLTEFTYIGPQFFDTLGVPLIRGREFDLDDVFPVAGGTAATVAGSVVINESMARRFFGETDPIGHQIRVMNLILGMGNTQGLYRIVGVTRDSKYRARNLREKAVPEFYLPYRMIPAGSPQVAFELGTANNPLPMIPSIRSAIQKIDPKSRGVYFGAIADMLDFRLAQERMIAQVTGCFSLFALVLAALGLYGILAYNVTQRTREIGVRVALGARSRDIISLVLRQGMGLTLIGCAAGAAAAMALAHFVASRLYGIPALDPLTFLLTFTVLIAVALLACWLPARRATKVDPMVALRAE